MMEALQEAEKRQAEMPAMAPPPVEIPKEGESRKDVMTVEDDETFRRRNLILIAIILVLVVALLSRASHAPKARQIRRVRDAHPRPHRGDALVLRHHEDLVPRVAWERRQQEVPRVLPPAAEV